MKKVLLILSMVFVTVMAHAQKVYQIPNSTFEEEFIQAYYKKVVFSKTYYDEPKGWHGYATLDASDLNATGRTGNKLVKTTDSRPGGDGHAIYVKATEILGIVANGVLTTGRIYTHSTNAKDATQNYNFSEPGYTNTDNNNHNSSFSQPFHGKPDALKVWVKFDAAEATKTSAYPYASVNAVIHSNSRYQDPEAVDYSSIKVAQAKNAEIANYGNWHELTIDFKYGSENGCSSDDPQYILVTFTTNASPGDGTGGDILYVDDISMVYYSELSSLVINGKSESLDVEPSVITNGNDVYNITVMGKCTEGCITATPKSQHASAVTTYDTANGKATIVVTANDGSTSTYNITFVPDVTEMVGNYNSIVTVNVPGMDETMTFNVINVSENAGGNNTADFTLNGFMFGATEVGNIELENVSPSWVGGKAALTYDGTITINGPVTEELGLTNLPMTMTTIVEDGKLSSTLAITWNGAQIDVTIIPAEFSYVENNGEVKTSGNIDDTAIYIMAMDFMNASKDITSIDFTEATVTVSEEYVAALYEMGWTNLLTYFAAGSSYSGNNIIVGGLCSSLVISDGAEFNAPNAFTATTASYTRSFNATADYVSSFVLPVAVPAANINGTVYELVGYEDGVLNFAEVTTTLEANKPYIVKATSANLLNDANNVSVAATTESTLENAVSGGAVHVGSYTSQSVASDASTSFYGYKGGVFVKANSGTLNPFRTMIKVSGEQTLSTLALSFDGEVTGIGSIVDGELQLNGTVNVYDLNGRLVRQGAKAANSLQGLPTGVYVVNGQKVMVK